MVATSRTPGSASFPSRVTGPYGARMQQVALFDLDNTLVDRRAAFTAWAAEFVADQGLSVSDLTWLLEADTRTTGTKGPFFQDIRERFALRETAVDLWQQYRLRMPELVRCRPEDLDALRRLRFRGWKIGIVTNGMTDNQRGKIQRTGLECLVDACCISDDVGIRKPDPRIFHLAIQHCGGAPTRGGWMVGDDPILDIRGGRDAGLHTILLQNRTATHHGDPQADRTAVSVAHAVDTILNT